MVNKSIQTSFKHKRYIIIWKEKIGTIYNEYNRIDITYGGNHGGGTFTASIAVTAQFPN